MSFRRFMLAGPWSWAALFFFLPLAIIVRISIAHTQIGVPPYTPLFGAGGIDASLDNYRDVFSDSLYWGAYLGALKIAGAATLLALILGYPMALAIARAAPARRTLLLLLVTLPFWTSLLIRIYAWIGLLRPGGIINTVLESAGLIDAPLHLINTTGAVCLGMVYAYLPFMVLPLYARLERQDPALLEAARDLGARPWRAFISVTLPLSAPGIVAGALLVFIPCVGEFVIPDLLGGPDTVMIGKVLWSEFFSSRDWPLSAALTVVMVGVLVIPILALQRVMDRDGAR
jgi:putrescine transport system permease protein